MDLFGSRSSMSPSTCCVKSSWSVAPYPFSPSVASSRLRPSGTSLCPARRAETLPLLVRIGQAV
jgi:hypothetical protein